MKQNVEYSCDVLIIGGGAAGSWTLALRLADHAKVMVLSKGPLSEGLPIMPREASLLLLKRQIASNLT